MIYLMNIRTISLKEQNRMAVDYIRATNIQRGCVYDGPGVRTTVFLKGCTMKCPWCCNPETISPEVDYFIDDSKCQLRKGISSKLCASCKRNGGNQPIAQCPFGVCEPTSHDYTVDELFEILSKDFDLMRTSGGGVTFSGGEPLLQIDALVPLLDLLKKEGINIAFETTLTTNSESVQKAVYYADVMIVDVKLQPQHPLYNNQSYISRLLNHLKICREGDLQILYRVVFTDDMLDASSYVSDVFKLLQIDSLELLKCHNWGNQKYIKLNSPYVIIKATEDSLIRFSELLVYKGFSVSKLSI